MAKPFIPEPYVDYKQGWAAAYLSIYGPMDQDADIAEQESISDKAARGIQSEQAERANRAKSVNIPKSLGAYAKSGGYRQPKVQLEPKVLPIEPIDTHWTDPIEYLFTYNESPARTERKLETRNILLQKLCTGEIKGYSPVVLSTLAMGYHQLYELPMPGVVDPIFQLGIWPSEAGPVALEVGKVKWAFSKFDTEQIRPLFFSGPELKKAFPPKATVNDIPAPTKRGRSDELVRTVTESLLRLYPNGIGTQAGAVKAAKAHVERDIGKGFGPDTFVKARDHLKAEGWAERE